MGRDFGRPTGRDFLEVAAAVNSIGRTFDQAQRREWTREDRERSKREMDQYKWVRSALQDDPFDNPQELKLTAHGANPMTPKYTGLNKYFAGFDPTITDMARKDQTLADKQAFRQQISGMTPDEIAQIDLDKQRNPLAAWQATSEHIAEYAKMTGFREKSRADDDAMYANQFIELKGHLSDMYIAQQQGDTDVAIAHAKKLIDTVPMPYRFLGATEDGKIRIGMKEEGKSTGEEVLTVDELYTRLSKYSGPEYVKQVRAFNKFKSKYNVESLAQALTIYKDGQIASLAGQMDDGGNHFAMVFSPDSQVRRMSMDQVWSEGWVPYAGALPGSGQAGGKSGGKSKDTDTEALQQQFNKAVYTRAREASKEDPNNPGPPQAKAYGLEIGEDGALSGIVDTASMEAIKIEAEKLGGEVLFSPVKYKPEGNWINKETGWEITDTIPPQAQTSVGLYAKPGPSREPERLLADAGPGLPEGAAPPPGKPSGKPDFGTLKAELGAQKEPPPPPQKGMTARPGESEDTRYLQKVADTAVRHGQTRPAVVPQAMWDAAIAKEEGRQASNQAEVIIRLALSGKPKPKGVSDAAWRSAQRIAAHQTKAQQRFMPDNLEY